MLGFKMISQPVSTHTADYCISLKVRQLLVYKLSIFLQISLLSVFYLVALYQPKQLSWLAATSPMPYAFQVPSDSTSTLGAISGRG